MKRFLLISMLLIATVGTCLAMVRSSSSPSIRLEEPNHKVKQNILPVHEHTESCDNTEAEPVQIICILDRSGSMSKLAEDTIGGYNSFLEQQKKEPGKAEVTTIIFDDKYEKIVDAVDLKKVPELTSAEYYARGNTALLDAVGRTIMEVAGKMEKERICPAKRRVLVLIMTDGKENASEEYDKGTVKSLIESTTNEYKWNYIFMGANIDSVSEAASIGIKSHHAADYAHNRAGIRESFSKMGAAAREMRETGEVSEDWKNE